MSAACGPDVTVRGDVYGERDTAYVQRVEFFLRLPEGPDPWWETDPAAEIRHDHLATAAPTRSSSRPSA